jgi:TonB family protein
MGSLLFVAVVIAAGLVMGAGDQERICESEDGVSLPTVIKEVKPLCPPGAYKDHAMGKVHLRCVVETDGKPTSIEVVQPVHDLLDPAASDALQQWEFEPGTRAGTPVPVRVTVVIAFTVK